MNRWQMHRAGIFNFWYYDDQEFQLEAGRLILRGANGSGKSVTMQSFLPLVLDGDKRPHRLDPFGSRDRRMEYYLLGDKDSDIQDRIGYLWLEFYHPGKQLYKTVGIGLRARRGVSRIGFWGFVLDDGRRINRDFWLYDRYLWLEQSNKLPLNRRALEEKMESGGQVVQEQAAYRDLVNKALFGFHESEAYQDLLQLLIQLRSPKLSKDFKPSSIYDILTEALPPLMEDELRPLSEVLEDMDQIADRLDVIRLHRREMEKLVRVYDQYNRYFLADHAEQLLNAHSEANQFERRVKHTAEEKESATKAKTDAEKRMAETDHRLQEIESELEVLNKHEAIGKQEELNVTLDQLKETDQDLKQARDRIAKVRQQWERSQRKMKQNEKRVQGDRFDQDQRLAELEAMAREAEFAEHDVYHRYWQPEVPETDDWRKEWHRDLKRHRDAVEAALETAREEQKAAQSAQDAGIELGNIRKRRDQAEQEHSRCEDKVEEEKEVLREQLVRWKQELRVLPLTDGDLRQSLQALTALEKERYDYATVRQPAVAAFDGQRLAMQRRQVVLEKETERLEEERKQLAEEKAAWESTREPEPPRSDARSRSRASRPAGTGAPLYAVCEFREGIDDGMKARIEAALETAGLLDAWISTDGRIGALKEGEEEVLLRPSPLVSEPTLADVLSPTPSPECGLKAETIVTVLRTIRWTSKDEGSGPRTSAAVNDGGFHLGPLTGRTAAKERAAYIGKETRRRTRLLEIARLEKALAACDEELEQLRKQRVRWQCEEETLQEELQRFPTDEHLQRAMEALRDIGYRLNALIDQEVDKQERLKEKTAVWRKLQLRLERETDGWVRLKRAPELKEALDLCRDYEIGVSDLHAAWRSHREALLERARLEEERAELRASLESDEELKEELEERHRRFKAKAKRLRQLMEELGITELHEQLRGLKEEREQRKRTRKQDEQVVNEVRDRLSRLSERVEYQQEELKRRQARLETAWQAWRGEMERALIPEWTQAYTPETSKEDALRLCKAMVRKQEKSLRQRSRDSVTNALLEVFNAVRQELVDYVLESTFEGDNRRILIFSMRDRMYPQPPAVVLDEIIKSEKEQEALLTQKDRDLYEEIILRSVGKAIRQRIQRAEQWVDEMNRLMAERNTSSGLQLKLKWVPKAAQNEQQLNTETLVHLLKRDAHRLHEEEIERIIAHFRSYITYAKQEAHEERDSLRKYIYEILDYRNWFRFVLYHRKGEQRGYQELTDARFNVLSGGEKAMAMYIPLFAATSSRYADAKPEAPRIISLDEAFAGVDEENMRDLFQLLTEMEFDYMMTSQVLWGCYDTVPDLSIYEIHRLKNTDLITLFRYRWNGRRREYVAEGAAE